MNNMFSGKNKKRIPKSLFECIKEDAVVTHLHTWAERLESWGHFLFIMLIIIGIISTIVVTVLMVDLYEEMAFVTCIASVITWAFYAFIEYCAYHVLALLISALASITQNTMISADVSLYQASKERDDARQQPEESASKAPVTPAPPVPQSPVQSPEQIGVLPIKGTDGKIICPICNTQQSANRSVCWNCEQKFSVQ